MELPDNRQLDIMWSVSTSSAYEVQTYDATDSTVYYEVVEDVIDYEDARDVIAEKYPNRKVLAVIRRKTLPKLSQDPTKPPCDAL